MEISILHCLNYNIHTQTAYSFFEFYATIIHRAIYEYQDKDLHKEYTKFFDSTSKRLKSLLSEEKMLSFNPSIVASANILIGLKESISLKKKIKIWPDELILATGYTIKMLRMCVSTIQNLLKSASLLL